MMPLNMMYDKFAWALTHDLMIGMMYEMDIIGCWLKFQDWHFEEAPV